MRSNPAESFKIAEQSKARTLLEETAMQLATSSGILETIDQNRIAVFNKRLSGLDARLSAQPTADQGAFFVEKSDLINEQAKYLKDLRQRNVKFASLSDVQFADIRAGQELLANDEVFVSYLTQEDGGIGLVYALDKSGLEIQIIHDSDIGRKILELRKELESRPSGKVNGLHGFSRSQEELGKLLLGPIANKLIGKKKITISPGEHFALIPFEALAHKENLLIESFDVSYVQSLSMLSLLAKRQQEYKSLNTRKDLFAMGGASYASLSQRLLRWLKRGETKSEFSPTQFENKLVVSNDPTSKPHSRQAMDVAWEQLPGSEREVRAVGKLFHNKQSTVLTKSEASEQNLQRLNSTGDLQNYKRFLFSAHGYINSSQAGLSAIVLSQDSKTKDADGYITAIEWPSYSLKSDLVVLSACNTAVGKVVNGEGILGLPFALFVAGNTNTLLTLWSIDDGSTSEFVERFFTKIKAGQSEVAALSQTKREFLKHNKYGHPLYWAPFVLYGH
jgi:CHAT domain-containing protein